MKSEINNSLADQGKAARREMRKRRKQAEQWKAPKPSRSRRRCGAQTRSGELCVAHVMPGRKRCRNHGGLSTGPRTPEGRAAIAASNKRRAEKRQAQAAAMMPRVVADIVELKQQGVL